MLDLFVARVRMGGVFVATIVIYIICRGRLAIRQQRTVIQHVGGLSTPARQFSYLVCSTNSVCYLGALCRYVIDGLRCTDDGVWRDRELEGGYLEGDTWL